MKRESLLLVKVITAVMIMSLVMVSFISVTLFESNGATSWILLFALIFAIIVFCACPSLMEKALEDEKR